MKLKTFTKTETQKLIDDLQQYWKLCAEVTAIAKACMKDAFEAHQRDYKWSIFSPFTCRVKDVETMTFKICGGEFRTVSDDIMTEHGFNEYLSCWFNDANPEYDFVDVRHTNIVHAAYMVGYWRQEHIAEFHNLLVNYAVKPLVPDAEDIKLIDILCYRIIKLQKFVDDYNAI